MAYKAITSHKNMLLRFLIPFLLVSCSGLEYSEREKIRRKNCLGEFIYRKSDDYQYAIADPQHTPRVLYPWENPVYLPRITKDFFRCKGSSLHPAITEVSDQGEPLCVTDCEGGHRHGLPVIHGKEGVYPILLDLLNFIQKKTGKRVIVTCGHRCPSHNAYADRTKKNQTSKHQIGAEVDFYVQSMEERPLEVIGLIMQYYEDQPQYQGKEEFLRFERYKGGDTETETLPWMNKEIFVKLFQKHEGRDEDNRHPHPYISIQVRFDRDCSERVVYTWKAANLGYARG